MSDTHLSIGVAQERYALPVRRVREVLRAPAISPVPGGPLVLLGLHNLRGRAIPIFDLAVLLGLEPAGRPRARAVVLEDAERLGALAVDAALGVATLAPAAAHPGPFLAGSVLDDEGLIGVLDVEALWEAVGANQA